jgi:tRNA threonylcarbamoyladenosine biosynthesis protein TsaE
MTDPLCFYSHCEANTQEFANQLATCLTQGLVIALDGQLGAGKTHFTRALCKALGCDEIQVNSPTFVLLQLYTDGRIPVAHFDTWRLADADEFLAIGCEEYLHSPHWLSIVEWASRVCDILPADHLQINILHTSINSRTFQLTPTGPRSQTVLDAFVRQTSTSVTP